MTSQAAFTRTDTPDGVAFAVTPAPEPSNRGCMLMICYIVAGGIIAVALMVGLASGAGLGPLLFSSILWGPVLGVALWGRAQMAKLPPRKPETLLVNRDGIRVGGRRYPAPEIAELLVRHPLDDGGAKVIHRPTTTGTQIGQSMAVRNYNCSFALMARLRSGSAAQVLVFGLTRDMGEALLMDIKEAMK